LFDINSDFALVVYTWSMLPYLLRKIHNKHNCQFENLIEIKPHYQPCWCIFLRRLIMLSKWSALILH